MTTSEKRIAYLAAPFFNQGEKQYTETIANIVSEAFGSQLSLYIPYIDTGIILTSISSEDDKDLVFKKNMIGIDNSDLLILILDNEDAGVCWEMGYAYARNMPMLALWTDVRKKPNLMLYKSAVMVYSIDELLERLPVLLKQ